MEEHSMSNRAEQWSLQVHKTAAATPRPSEHRFGLICLVLLVLLALLGISVSLMFAANQWIAPELLIGP
jgi:hypothetical protein